MSNFSMNAVVKFFAVILVLASCFLVSCHDAGPEKPPVYNYFISASQGASFSSSSLKALALFAGQANIASLISYNVKSYKLVYQTTFKGKTINASGLILFPDGMKQSAHIISIQHGTTFLKSDAPTIAGSDGMELFAAAGYITIIPDFIGYGESASLFHPYYDKNYSATAVIDMIKASKEFLTTQQIAFTEKLFLAGYSEGGYVMLAVAKEIETNPAHELTVTAVAAGAGGYDLNDIFAGIATEAYYSYPSYIAFVLMAYNNTYDWGKPLNYFFAEPYATTLATYMDGTHDGDVINRKLTTDMPTLFDAGFYTRLSQPDGEANLKQAIAGNDVSGWKTIVPIRLYHGTSDEIIPYSNSETTLQHFKDAGSTTVSLTPIAGGTHGSSLEPMIEDVIPWLITFN